MTDTRLYHNRHCSKSRGALALLRRHGVAPQLIHYLETPPSAEDLRDLLAMLALPARSLLRTGEPEYTQLGLDRVDLSEAALIDAMVQHPRLIERPIFVHGGRAVIGRPPECVLELLD